MKNDNKNVFILMLPLNYNSEKESFSGFYDYIPSSVFLYYHTLKRAGINVEGLNCEFLFNQKTESYKKLKDAILNKISAEQFQYCIIPICKTESFNEYANINISLVKKIMVDIKNKFPNIKFLLTGRILTKQKLIDTIGMEFLFAPVSYEEDRDICRMILNKEPVLEPLIYNKKEIEALFHISHVLKPRDPKKWIIVYGQRGCAFTCTFCERFISWPEKKVIQLPMEDTIKTISFYSKEYHWEYFGILDPVFNWNKAHLKSFCEKIKPLNVKWHCEIKSDLATPEDLILMHDAGCYSVLFGIESFDENILKMVNKQNNCQKILDNIDLCNKIGITVILSFVIGLGKTIQDAYTNIHKTANFLGDNKLMKYVNVVPYFFYSGTRDYIQEFGDQNFDIFPKFHHPFKIFFMYDMITLLHNLMIDSYIEIKGKKIYSFLDLFQVMVKNPDYQPDSSIFETIIKNDPENGAPIMNFCIRKLNSNELLKNARYLSELYNSNIKRSLIDIYEDMATYE